MHLSSRHWITHSILRQKPFAKHAGIKTIGNISFQLRFYEKILNHKNNTEMKKIIVSIGMLLFAGIAFLQCERSDDQISSNSSSLKLLGVSNIKVQNGMLCFDSWDHYESTIHTLAAACENHVAQYIDSISTILNCDNDSIINCKIEEDGFSQFTPLHDFADELHFNSLYNKLENEENVWMEDTSATEYPFGNTSLERYQTALHNENGDVVIDGKIYNPDKKKEDGCIKKGQKSKNSNLFLLSNGRYGYLHGEIKTNAVSFSASTSLYQIKNGKVRKCFGRGLGVADGGKKLTTCDYYYQTIHEINMKGNVKTRPSIPLCYESVYETITSHPNYLYTYSPLLWSDHAFSTTNTVIHLTLP